MPSLRGVLKETMLFVAAEGIGTLPEESGASFAAPPIPTTEVDDDDAPTLALWHWTTTEPASVKEVTCISRGMGNARMLVCDEIRYGDVFVQPVGGQPTPLEISSTFLVKSFGLDAGLITAFDPNVPARGSRALYPLAANVDKSYLHALAYEFPDGFTNSPRPVSAAVLDSEDFMPAPASPTGVAEARGGERVTITVGVPRVLVIISLVCGKERADFDPGALLGSARMTPHIMIMCNQPLQSARGTVSLKRPAKLRMLEGGDHHLHHTQMNDELEIALYTDENQVSSLPDDPFPLPVVGLGVPSPFWDDLFAGYLLGSTSNTVTDATGKVLNTEPFVVVDPDKPARSISGAVEKLRGITSVLGPRPYAPATLNRVARQGGFDNLHLAPTMKTNVNPDNVKVPLSPADKIKAFGLNRVFMAPFCEHDCLHTHWRWGTTISQAHNFGWSAPSAAPALVPGLPYQVAGAPMVPHNQHVRIDVNGPTQFHYRVTAGQLKRDGRDVPIPPGTFTFINHHGSGYAVHVGFAFTALKAPLGLLVAARLEPLINQPDETGVANSAFLYWHLRFGGNGALNFHVIQERVRYPDMGKVIKE